MGSNKYILLTPIEGKLNDADSLDGIIRIAFEKAKEIGEDIYIIKPCGKLLEVSPSDEPGKIILIGQDDPECKFPGAFIVRTRVVS